MTKHKTKLLVIVTLILGTAAALVPFVLWTAHAQAPEYSGANNSGATRVIAGKATASPTAGSSVATIAKSPAVTQTPVSTPPAGSSAWLNARHRFALGMIETANNDEEIGGAGEVSRYQIMPSVWKHYSDSRDYQDPNVSLEVAQRHWSALHASFKQQAHREPTDFDMYVLWNTRYGYYASKGFNPARLHPVVRDRAQRFANLVERGES